MSSYNFSQRLIKRISNKFFYESIDFTPKYIKKTPIIAKPCNLVKILRQIIFHSEKGMKLLIFRSVI